MKEYDLIYMSLNIMSNLMMSSLLSERRWDMLLLSVAIKILFKNTADKCFHKLSRQTENIWYYYQCILIILMHTDLLDS